MKLNLTFEIEILHNSIKRYLSLFYLGNSNSSIHVLPSLSLSQCLSLSLFHFPFNVVCLYKLYYKWNTTTLVPLLCILFIFLALACQPVFACDLSRMNPLPFSQEFPPLSSPHLMSYVPLMFDQWQEREGDR